MTEEQIKEVIFNTLILVQGFPPIDTQLAEWEKAVSDMYLKMLPALSFPSTDRAALPGHDETMANLDALTISSTEGK